MSHPMWVRGLKHAIILHANNKTCVAPYVGAWIETMPLKTFRRKELSHPMWVRGLKLNSFIFCYIIPKSHPMWVRGLKPCHGIIMACYSVAPYVGAWIETCTCLWQTNTRASHPMWVRGLKQDTVYHHRASGMSHPMWVRGLKHGVKVVCFTLARSRTLCGCVD